MSRNGGRMSRNGAYRWLAERMKLALEECHIGMMDAEQCARVVALAEAYLEKVRAKV